VKTEYIALKILEEPVKKEIKDNRLFLMW